MLLNSFLCLVQISKQFGGKIFYSPNAASWTNALKLAQLLFTLPVSNGKLERIFSTLKYIKRSKRSSLSNELLDDLLAINVDNVMIKDFNADSSIELWWNAKSRRPNQHARKLSADIAGESEHSSSELADIWKTGMDSD